MATRYLKKSRFKLALTCPTKLFYTDKKEYANTSDDDAFMAMLADGGFQVGELAKLMYPAGVEIKTKDSTQALAETKQSLAQQNVVLFEPAIAFEGYLIRVDVLVKRGDVFEVIEVKAKSETITQAELEVRDYPSGNVFLVHGNGYHEPVELQLDGSTALALQKEHIKSIELQSKYVSLRIRARQLVNCKPTSQSNATKFTINYGAISK